jgi:hypothetical protein
MRKWWSILLLVVIVGLGLWGYVYGRQLASQRSIPLTGIDIDEQRITPAIGSQVAGLQFDNAGFSAETYNTWLQELGLPGDTPPVQVTVVVADAVGIDLDNPETKLQLRVMGTEGKAVYGMGLLSKTADRLAVTMYFTREYVALVSKQELARTVNEMAFVALMIGQAENPSDQLYTGEQGRKLRDLLNGGQWPFTSKSIEGVKGPKLWDKIGNWLVQLVPVKQAYAQCCNLGSWVVYRYCSNTGNNCTFDAQCSPGTCDPAPAVCEDVANNNPPFCDVAPACCVGGCLCSGGPTPTPGGSGGGDCGSTFPACDGTCPFPQSCGPDGAGGCKCGGGVVPANEVAVEVKIDEDGDGVAERPVYSTAISPLTCGLSGMADIAGIRVYRDTDLNGSVEESRQYHEGCFDTGGDGSDPRTVAGPASRLSADGDRRYYYITVPSGYEVYGGRCWERWGTDNLDTHFDNCGTPGLVIDDGFNNDTAARLNVPGVGETWVLYITEMENWENAEMEFFIRPLPQCRVSGPSSLVAGGAAGSYTVSGTNTTNVQMFTSPETSVPGAWSSIYGPGPGGSVNWSCPAAGTYYLTCNGYGPTANCTGDPWCEWLPDAFGAERSDCGAASFRDCINADWGASPNDAMKITCAAPPTCANVTAASVSNPNPDPGSTFTATCTTNQPLDCVHARLSTGPGCGYDDFTTSGSNYIYSFTCTAPLASGGYSVGCYMFTTASCPGNDPQPLCQSVPYCVDPPRPTALQPSGAQACSNSATQNITFSWDQMAGADRYYFRLDNLIDPWSNCGVSASGDLCADVTGNCSAGRCSHTVNNLPMGTSWSWWVHSRETEPPTCYSNPTAVNVNFPLCAAPSSTPTPTLTSTPTPTRTPAT